MDKLIVINPNDEKTGLIEGWKDGIAPFEPVGLV